jgi:oxygen-dependent protoporphyrinogen oxidase
VIGGGISGLSAAWELSSSSSPQGTRIVVLEASSRLGGNLRSSDVGGRVVDLGADAFLARRPEAVELCRELGIEDTLVAPGSPTASVWAKGALRPLPGGLVLGVPTRLGPLARSGIISPLGLARVGIDLISPRRADASSAAGDRSVGEVVASRLGGEVRDMFAGPLVGGIHAGRVDELSAEAVFPALLEASRKSGSLMRALRPPDDPTRAGPGSRSEATPAPTGGTPTGGTPVFLSPVSGMASLPEKLSAALRARGVELLTSKRVDRLRRVGPVGGGGPGTWSISGPSIDLLADALVIALPAHAAAGLLGEVDGELAGLVGGVPSASVVLVTLLMDSGSLSGPLSGTGFLVPAIDGGLVTASTFLSTKWPHLASGSDVIIRASAGRAGDDRPSSMGDEELVATVRKELDRMIGPSGDPRQVVVTRFEDAFPQYLVGHVARVSAIEAAAARLPAFALAGATYHGIGVPACVGSGRRAARHVLSSLNQSDKVTGPGSK